MSFQRPTTVNQKPLEDPLAYLPCSTTVEYQKGEIIYGQYHPCENLYLVVSGLVKISWVSASGLQIVLDFHGPDELFGERSLLHPTRQAEEATCYQRAALMSWHARQIEEIITKRPRLGLALLQVFGSREIELTERVESLCFDSIDRRLARSLIRLAERLGTQRPDGSISMAPLSHEVLSQHVATSREVVTCSMINLRRLGHIQYSRRSIVVCRDGLKAWLDQPPNEAAPLTTAAE